MKPTDIEIIEWNDKYSKDYMALSIEWLEKYVSVEPADLEILNNPHGAILDDGGNIFFAKCDGRIVGTVSMIPNGVNCFELAKLAVTEEYKGRRIGNLLMEHALDFARCRGAKRVILYTNHKLIPAIRLYEKYGFYKVSLENNKYLEADIKMEYLL